MPLFIATCRDARIVRSRPRRPGQSAARLWPLPVAFLSALPAAAIHRLAAGLQRLLCPARPSHGAHVGHRSAAANPMGFLVDRFGARPFLIGGTLVMTSSIAAMGFATAYWQIVVLALLSGVGNSVFHPADYAILSGSIDPARLGRSFAFHTFAGNIGFAAAPPATAALMLLFGWRGALIFVGLLGLPAVAAIVWQSRILIDQARRPQSRPSEGGVGLLLSRSVLMFFAFFMVTAMAGAGIQSWLITILHQVHGVTLAAASSALTGYMVGQIGGVLVGG